MQNELEKAGGTIIAICSDKIADNKRVKEKNSLKFDILSDAKSEVIKAYGLHFREPMRDIDIALPANFLIDKEGKIAWQWIAPRVQDRADPAVVAEEVAELVNKK